MRLPVSALAAVMLAGAAAHAADRGIVQTQPGFGDAVTSPLEDLNLKKSHVPDLLVRAQASPYDTTGLDHCEAVAGEIGRLDAILGPDLDEAPPPDTRSGTAKAAGQVKGAAVDVAQDRVHSLIPFRGLIRRLTGAEHGARALQDAIRAGQIRRGYLKGVGMHMNCAPPAAPSWFVPVKASERHDGAGPVAEPIWSRWWKALVGWIEGLLKSLGL